LVVRFEMTEPEPVAEARETVDYSTVPIADAPAPDFRASKPKRDRNYFKRPAGDKAGEPPKTTATRKPPPKRIPNRKGQFVEPLTAMYTGIGMAIFPLDPVCGTAVLKSASKCAESLDALAYKNDAVRRALFALMQTSAVGAVVFAHMPIVLAVILHHVPAAQTMLGDMGTKFAESVIEGLNADVPPPAPEDDNAS
jgi:hypothetical protein